MARISVLLAVGVALGAAALPAQIPFTSPAHYLPANTQGDFQILTLPSFKDHAVRIRTPKGLCDPAVQQRSGYLDVAEARGGKGVEQRRGYLDAERHFFFWLFDSRNDPVNDPVVLWCVSCFWRREGGS